MRQKAEWLRQRPAWCRIGREALVISTDRRFKTRIIQILIEHRQINRHHQPLVGDHLVGQAADVEIGIVRECDFSLATCNEQADGEFALAFAVGMNKDLFDLRKGIFCNGTKTAVIGWHFSPAQHLQPFGLQR
jgi:hypothetical protein